MDIPSKLRRGDTRLVAIFDLFIIPPPNNLCVEKDSGEIICDFTNAPEELHPGIHLPDNNVSIRRRAESGEIIFSDGSSQTIWPTLYSPDTFIEEAKKEFSGVERIVFSRYGTFYVLFEGEGYLIIPSFNIETKPVGGNLLEPNIVINNDGTLTYTVTTNPQDSLEQPLLQENTGEVLIFNPSIQLAPDDLCVETESGELLNCNDF